MSKDYYNIRVAEVLEHGESSQGQFAAVKVLDDNGSHCVVHIPHEAVGAFQLKLLDAAAHAAKTRAGRGHTGDQSSYGMRLERYNIGVLGDNSVLFRLQITGGMTLDLPIPPQDVDKLLDGLRAAKKEAMRGKAKPKH